MGGRGRRRRGRGQRGFTLIEMLIVISILGILAMVVSMSMVGITNLARARADQAELMTVQAAMDAMMMDEQIDPADACAGAPAGGTNDMSKFPNGSDWSRSASGVPVRLWPHYLRKQWLDHAYVCTEGGTVRRAGG